MKYVKREMHDNNERSGLAKISMACCCSVIFLLSIYGCSNEPPSQPAQKAPVKSASPAAKSVAAPQPETVVQETPEPEGYVYQRRDRRDPFVPLIVPKLKLRKGAGAKVGTMESYDIHEFTLAAIAKKGGQYYALITTPDNRSFTVNKGVAIGMNKGKIKEITKNRIVIVEYSKDFRGQLLPKELILEFHKGEVE